MNKEQENKEQDLIQMGLENGLLCEVDKDNFPFEHILVPESVYPQWEGRTPYVTSFPDRFLPSGFQIPMSPVFGIHSVTGDLMTGSELEVDSSMMEAKKVWARKVGSRLDNLRPSTEESQERYDMIGSAMKASVELGLKYFYCMLETRILLPSGLMRNEVAIVVRGA